MKKAAILALVAIALMAISPVLSAEDGAATFKAKCAMCHGANGEGKAKNPALNSADVKKMSDADLTTMIAEGGKDKKPMHAFKAKGLTDEQIKALVSHIRSLK
jgi:mono/diheme cytochrome c family protein